MSPFFAHPSILISASQLEPAIVLAYRVLRVERTNYPSLTSLLVFRVSSRLCIGQSEHALDWMKHKIHVDDKATLRPPATQPKESEVELRPVSNLSEHAQLIRKLDVAVCCTHLGLQLICKVKCTSRALKSEVLLAADCCARHSVQDMTGWTSVSIRLLSDISAASENARACTSAWSCWITLKDLPAENSTV
jgi:hypothetical protein